jgi:deoxycytidylate deaminase
MISGRNFRNILKANELQYLSNCTRRKIGVYIPIPDDDCVLSAIAGNAVQSTIHCCMRDAGICPAVHAEVRAINNLGSQRYSATELYIWAEIPCHACLSYIHQYSYIRDIYCLTQESYGNEYPRVLDRTSEIKLRKDYATVLGIDVHELDAEEIKEYGLLRHPHTECEPNPEKCADMCSCRLSELSRPTT